MTSHNERYGVVHRSNRSTIDLEIQGGTVRCARADCCKWAELVNGVWLGGFIHRGEPWDLDHKDEGSGYLGASHRACNRAAGGRRKSEPGNTRNSRVW